MRKKLTVLLFVTAAFLAGYGYRRWYAKPQAVAAKTTQRPLYYRCPMHSSEQSDRPGMAPCNMAMVPVYANDVSNMPADAELAYNSLMGALQDLPDGALGSSRRARMGDAGDGAVAVHDAV